MSFQLSLSVCVCVSETWNQQILVYSNYNARCHEGGPAHIRIRTWVLLETPCPSKWTKNIVSTHYHFRKGQKLATICPWFSPRALVFPSFHLLNIREQVFSQVRSPTRAGNTYVTKLSSADTLSLYPQVHPHLPHPISQDQWEDTLSTHFHKIEHDKTRGHLPMHFAPWSRKPRSINTLNSGTLPLHCTNELCKASIRKNNISHSCRGERRKRERERKINKTAWRPNPWVN